MSSVGQSAVRNGSSWSHSTNLVTILTTYQKENVPALTSVWTPPTGCSGRWVAQSAFAIGTPFTVPASRALENQSTSKSPVQPTTTRAALRRATKDPTFLPVITSETGRVPYNSLFPIAYSTFPRDIKATPLYDNSYSKCQPFSVPVHFSPGLCPHGQTVAEVTEYDYPTTSGSTVTMFEASCCQRYVLSLAVISALQSVDN